MRDEFLQVPTATEIERSPPEPQRRNAADPDPNLLTAQVLRSAFDRQPEAAIVVNPFTGAVQHANRAAHNIFNRADERLAGVTIDQLYPGARGEIHAFTDEILHRGYAWSRDLKLYGASGDALNVEHAGVTGSGPDGDFIIVTIFDLNRINRRTINEDANSYHRKGIGEWQRIQRYFRDLERENDLILSAAGEGIYGVDLQGLTTFLNPAAEKMLGYSAEELVGKDMHATIHHHHADGSVHEVEACPIYNAFKQGVINTIEDDVFWCKDGRSIRVQYTSTPILDSGIVVGAVIVFRDITQRKHDEEKLSAALEENARLRERLEMENAYLQEEILSHSNHREILGASNVVHQVLKQIDLVAPTEANVLITGESGTGKELVARAIHQASNRCDRPLIRVNCAAIPRELFESEFFGHIKGAFTGAIRDRVGRFELADGGTLFLDEVGEIPIDLQSKLLRVLQDRRFERVGEEKTRSVDVRVIAATNRDLKAEVRKGNFREDLYFRLNVFPVECRPLRERLDDIPILAQHFLDLCCTRMNLKSPQLTKANIADLMAYDWPGNARELQNVVEHAAILARRGRLRFNLPRPALRRAKNDLPEFEPDSGVILTASQMTQMEETNICRALTRSRGRVSGEDGAAALLGMKPTTLYSRLKKMDLPHKLRSN